MLRGRLQSAFCVISPGGVWYRPTVISLDVLSHPQCFKVFVHPFAMNRVCVVQISVVDVRKVTKKAYTLLLPQLSLSFPTHYHIA